MPMTSDRIKKIGGRFFDVAMGVFLIAVLVLIWNSSRTRADSGAAAKATATKKTKIRRSANIEALTALQGTSCVVTCPPDITTPATTPTCAVVSFVPPVGAFCTGPAVCVPASGFCFPIGVTAVTCTAPGPGAAQCGFNVTVVDFDVCLQDDSNPSTVFRGNSASGAYTFCCGTTTFTGIAQVIKRGKLITWQHNPLDRRVVASFDGAQFKGTAAIQSPASAIKCTIGDRDTRNNTCVCGNPQESRH